MYKAVARGVPQVHVHPLFKKKKASTFSKKNYNMNKHNFDLTFL